MTVQISSSKSNVKMGEYVFPDRTCASGSKMGIQGWAVGNLRKTTDEVKENEQVNAAVLIA